MPGFRKMIVVTAFDRDADGRLEPAFGPRQMETEESAVYAAQTLISDHAGVVAWSREANPCRWRGRPDDHPLPAWPDPGIRLRDAAMTTLPKDIDEALARYMADHGLGRDAAVSKILAEWLGAHYYLGDDGTAQPEDTQQTVQYPEFMDDASGGAGG